MLIKCKEQFGQQLSPETLYFVIEIYINISTGSVQYRLVDDEGCPAIYEAKKFEIISNEIDGFTISIADNKLVLSPKLIAESELNKKNINGFWGCYFEDPQYSNRAKETLRLFLAGQLEAEDTGTVHLSSPFSHN